MYVHLNECAINLQTSRIHVLYCKSTPCTFGCKSVLYSKVSAYLYNTKKRPRVSTSVLCSNAIDVRSEGRGLVTFHECLIERQGAWPGQDRLRSLTARRSKACRRCRSCLAKPSCPRGTCLVCTAASWVDVWCAGMATEHCCSPFCHQDRKQNPSMTNRGSTPVIVTSHRNVLTSA